ncbi:MAG TPA: HEPN domain-containing protein [Solirubrobacteraceae bacterium]
MSPSPEQIEYAELLLDGAKGRVHVCRVLKDQTEIGDSIIGFHTHAAVEKALRVALVLTDVELPLTHDLDFLVQLVREAGIDLPTSLADTGWLTPWAAEFRYDEPTTLDRAAALTAAEKATGWAASLLTDWPGGG